MKTQLFVLFCTLFLSVDAFAQNPTWINQEGSMNYAFNKYDIGGYNEQAYLWQNTLLKGEVQSCTILERINDSILVANSKYGMYYGKLSYNMEFVYNDKKQLEQLIVNDEDYKYKSPKTVKNIRKESLTWVLDQLQTRAYWLEDQCELLISYIYADNGQLKKEQWSSIYQGAQQIIIFPFEVTYEHTSSGAYTVKGIFKEDFDSEKGILKYLLEFDKKGYLIKRTLYNRDLRSRVEKRADEVEMYTYSYNEKGYMDTMIYRKGSEKPVKHCYKYTNYDNVGNWQLQQVYDDKKVLLFEMERVIEYK